MTDSKSNILEVIKGYEHELIINQDITDKTKLMYPAFLQAREVVGSIIQNTERWWQDYGYFIYKQNDIDMMETQQYNSLYGYANNVIAFFAARGQGKTSTMLSFSNALSLNGTEGGPHLFQTGKSGKEWRHFYTLPPIDPTMLSARDSILTVILSHLTKRIEQLWQQGSKNTWDREREKESYAQQEQEHWKILKAIADCQNGINMRHSSKAKNAERTDLENVLRDTDVMDVKIHLHQIFSYFFRLKQWDREDSMLVIQLDDTDMKLDNAYEVLEDVRKYLSIPNVVVLMACYRKQLQHLVEVEYRDRLKENESIFESIPHMAAKYIDKLISPSHMIFLPSLKELWDKKYTPKIIREKEPLDPYTLSLEERLRYLEEQCKKKSSEEGDPNKANSFSEKKENKEKSKELSLESYIYSQIYEKTGMVFIGHQSFTHHIIPSTLRGLTALIDLLENMPYLREHQFPSFQ